MKTCWLLVGLLIAGLCYAHDTNTPVSIAGKWVSYGWKSESPTDKLVVTYVFRTNNTCSVSTTSAVSQPILMEGTFQLVTENDLRLILPGWTMNLKIALSNDILTIDDPRIKNPGKFKRMAEPANSLYSSPASPVQKQ